MSSAHAHAARAGPPLAGIARLPLDPIAAHAHALLAASPVAYLAAATLHGTLFDPACASGAVSAAFTDFFIDHAGFRDALRCFEERGAWTLGTLPEGHEFLVIVDRGEDLQG